MKLHPIKSADEMFDEIMAQAKIEARLRRWEREYIKDSGRPGHILALLVIVGVIVAVTIAMKYFGPSLGLQPGSGLP